MKLVKNKNEVLFNKKNNYDKNNKNEEQQYYFYNYYKSVYVSGIWTFENKVVLVSKK